MPWSTPTLKSTRLLVRDYVLGQLGAKVMIPNSALRIMSDTMAGLANLAFLYLDWLAKQLLPDTAEKEWLDRHGKIWLVNADGSKGRKSATYSSGNIQYVGVPGIVMPIGTTMTGGNAVTYQTTTAATIDLAGFGTAQAVALTAGTVGNLADGSNLFLNPGNPSISAVTAIGEMTGGVDTETDDQLRERILFRIQNPPMGGSQADYIAWAMSMPGVTRAWAATELGPGTMTVRFLMDDLYPDNHGLPTQNDIQTVYDYIARKRPVTVVDCFVMAPILFFYNITISSLVNDTPTTRGNIEASIAKMERVNSAPGQTMYRSWVDDAISEAVGEVSHELDFDTTPMPAPGYMPALGTVLYV
jgi:uncharacterized phage protein gp47/JayE